MIWVILCEFIDDFMNGVDFSDFNRSEFDGGGDFISNYKLNIGTTLLNALLIVFYFAFTSLTTVGFGDYYP